MGSGRVLIVCVITAAITSSATFFLLRHVTRSGSAADGQVDVPSVVDLTPAQARPLLELRGLLLAVSETRRDSQGKPGHILSQQPAAGMPARKGSAVQVVVAEAGDDLRVPRLAGLPLAAARQVLSSAGLTPGQVTLRASQDIPAGQVMGSSPQEGGQAARQTPVALVVSSGPSGATVPSVVGKALPLARRLLSEAGLEVGATRSRYNEDLVEGVVLSQDPAQGTMAPRGSAVNLVINRE